MSFRPSLVLPVLLAWSLTVFIPAPSLANQLVRQDDGQPRLTPLQQKQVQQAQKKFRLGAQLKNLRQLGRASTALGQALKTFQETLGEDNLQTATVHFYLGDCLSLMGEYQAAHRQLVAAARFFKAKNERANQATIYNAIGTNFQVQALTADAQPYLDRALAIRRQLLNEVPAEARRTIVADMAQSFQTLAENLSDQGRDADARDYLERAVKIFGTLQKPGTETGRKYMENMATSQQNLGSWYFAQARYAEAESLLRKTLETRHRLEASKQQDPDTLPETAYAHDDLANSLKAQQKFAEAQEHYQAATTILRKALPDQHPDLAIVSDDLADNYLVQGQHDLARKTFQQSLQIRQAILGNVHQDTVRSHVNLGQALYDQGQYPEALARWKIAAELFEPVRMKMALSGLGRAVSSGEQSPHQLLAAVTARAGSATAAWKSYEQSLSRGLLDDLASRGKKTSLSDADRQREAQLVAQCRRVDAQVALLNYQDVQARQKTLATLRQTRATLQADLSEFRQQLATRYGIAAGTTYSLKRIQSTLSATTALVSWLDLPGRENAEDPNGEHWAVLLRHTGDPRWIRLPGNEGEWFPEDEGLGADLANELKTTATQGLQATGAEPPEIIQQLREQRFSPLEPFLKAGDELPAVEHLVVLPSNLLRGVPIELLAGDGLTVSYAPSATLFAWLQEQRKTKPSAGPLLALGDPVFTPGAVPTTEPTTRGNQLRYGGQTFAALPATRWEVETIASVFRRRGTGQHEVLLGSDASQQRLADLSRAGTLKTFRYLHLATHGVPDPQRPMRSRLILSRDRLPGTTEQLLSNERVFRGELTAGQILEDWTLDADLVVLSACQSGLGRFAGGEGYLGFAQALLLSGARSLLLSLWEVDDKATALLMTRFYENLLGARRGLKRPLARARALAEARRWLRTLTADQVETMTAAWRAGRTLETLDTDGTSGEDSPYAHPVFWAAFILVGDPG